MSSIFGGQCDGCVLRDQMIQDLRAQLEETNKSLLALADARAYAIRYPAEKAARLNPSDRPQASSPGEIRRQTAGERPILTREEIEASFVAEERARQDEKRMGEVVAAINRVGD